MNPPALNEELPADPHAAAATLLGRTARGDRDAFSELYDRVSSALFATILTIVRDRAEAEDVLQECFCSVWDHAGQFESARGKAISWMLTIARNQADDHVAKTKRRSDLPDRIREKSSEVGNAESPVGDGFATLALSEESAAVRQAVRDLPEDQREAIQLAFLKGMTQSEVADHLDQPLGTIKARIRRELFQLRGNLQPYLARPAS